MAEPVPADGQGAGGPTARTASAAATATPPAGAKAAPAFGRHMLAHWWLDPAGVYLNHGTVGVTSRRVLAAQQALQQEIERHPARFMLHELVRVDGVHTQRLPRLSQAAEAVAGYLGAQAQDLVFLDNASAGINAVLRSLPLVAGDEILLLDHAYGAVARTAAFVARERGATLVTQALPFPVAEAAQAVAVVEAALTPRTRLVVLDHISSETALLLPVAAMAAACRARGVAVLVDGAHAPGAIALDLPALGVDWYVANLHKWAFAPRGCGLLWAAPGRQAGLHPAVISWGLDQGWQAEFDWTGTRDPSPWLCAPEGLRFLTDELGEAPMRAHNHALAWQAALMLTRRWGLPWTTPEDLIACMATIPLPDDLGEGAERAGLLRARLLEAHAIEVPVIARGGHLWLRVSAQVYNDDSDIERLARAVDLLRCNA